MEMSYSALNRILENHLKSDAALRKRMEKSGPKVVLSDGRKLTDEALMDKLACFGVTVDRQTFGEWRKEFLSAEAMFKGIIDKWHIDVKEKEIDWIWVCLAVLWERWSPEKPSLEMIDDMMQAGYEKSAKSDEVAACDIWLKVWGQLLEIADRKNVPSLHDLDRIFRGSQSIFNWVQDLETELWNAGIKEKQFIAERIFFCEEFLRRFPYGDPLILENMKRALGGAYFDAGEREKADSLFQEWLYDDPRWGWGWIGWADCYWLNPGSDKDYETAEKILKKGVAVPDVRDREDLLERLQGIYSETGRGEMARAFNKEESTSENTVPVKRAKVGRNEPCPCGSGKKYKKCCGG